MQGCTPSLYHSTVSLCLMAWTKRWRRLRAGVLQLRTLHFVASARWGLENLRSFIFRITLFRGMEEGPHIPRFFGQCGVEDAAKSRSPEGHPQPQDL